MRLNDSSAALDLSERNSLIVVKVNCYLFGSDGSHYDPHLESRPPYLELIGSRAAVSTRRRNPLRVIRTKSLKHSPNSSWIELEIFKCFHYEHHRTHLNITVFRAGWLNLSANRRFTRNCSSFWPKGREITCQSSLSWNYAIQLICICRRIIEWPRTIIKEPDGHCRRLGYSQL